MSRRALVVSGAALALLAVLAVLASRTSVVRAALWDITGEENVWEGVKGTVAAAILASTAPALELAPDAPLLHRGENPIGVNTFLQLEADPENVRRSAAAMRGAGIGWARQQFPWEDIEIHGPGDFEDRRNDPPRSAWAKYDALVDTLIQHNVQLLARLDDPPDWAYGETAPVGHKGPPDNLDDYGDFVAAVVGRYCARVRYYQLWNEPNIYPEWGEGDVDPAGYAELLRIGAARARAACPDVVIVSAAMAQTTEAGGRNMDDLKYLEALYEAGWQNSFDVMGAQAFGLWTGPTDRRVGRDRANFGRVQLARDIMVRHGDGSKPIWITEMGWDSPPEAFAAPYGRVDEEARARYTTAAYERIAREWPWVGVAFTWFLRRPNWEWHHRPEGWFRLLEPDWRETPTYQALADLGSRAPVARRGRHGPWSRALAFTGPWKDDPPGGPVATRIGMAGAELQVNFAGTGLTVALRPGTAGGEPPTLYTVLDGTRQTLQPTARDGRWMIDLGPVANGTHLAIVRVEAGEAAVQEVVVQAPEPGSPLTTLAWRAAGLLAALLAIALAWWALRRRRYRAKRRSARTDTPGAAPSAGTPTG